MHIHGNQMNLNSASLYSAAGAEKAAAAQRSAEVRKKLLRSAAIEGTTDPEEALLIGHWLGSAQGQVLNEDEYHSSASGRNPDFV